MPYDPVQSACKEAHKKIDAMMAEVTKVRAELSTLKTDVSGGGITQMQPYPWGKSLRPRSYCSVGEARRELTRLYEASKPIGEVNAEAAKKNRTLCAAAVAYMTALGVPEERRVPKPGTRSHKNVTVTAEWKSALEAAFPQYSGWERIEQAYKEYMAECDKWDQEEEIKARDTRNRQEAETKKANYIKLAASMATHYGLKPTAPADEVFDAVLNSDKYLRLAYWLERNRDDWNDGSNYAEIGLRGFSVQDDQDGHVHDCISDLIANWDGDGRCFRDCDWNYGRLFEIARQRNPSAMIDYGVLSEAKGRD